MSFKTNSRPSYTSLLSSIVCVVVVKGKSRKQIQNRMMKTLQTTCALWSFIELFSTLVSMFFAIFCFFDTLPTPQKGRPPSHQVARRCSRVQLQRSMTKPRDSESSSRAAWTQALPEMRRALGVGRIWGKSWENIWKNTGKSLWGGSTKPQHSPKMGEHST